MSLERFCRKHMVTASPDDSALHIARLMRDEHVGAVVIVDEGEVPVGIVTDRDMTLRVIAGVRDVTAPGRAVMTADPVTIRQDAGIDEVVTLMRRAHVRRLPVVDGSGALVGIVTLDDVNVLLAGELGAGMAAVRDNRGP
jgi:CBS domain-containing protein